MPNNKKSLKESSSDTTMGGDEGTTTSMGGGGTPPSNNLWIGNLTTDTTEADLMGIFERYGIVDTVTNYASRNYAFIYFKRLEDSSAAKDGLQNTLLRGNSIRIEFARPAKPAKNLWVGGISSTVSKEQLEEEFLKFGEIANFKFLRDRNSALVEFSKLEDAVKAVKTMNGMRFGGEHMRVDFLRSQPFRRDNKSDTHERDGDFSNRNAGPPESYWGPPDAVRDFSESSQFGHKRHQALQQSGGRREGQPSKVLWVGYPPSVQIDEQMLHNAMILFGEIERIKSFPSRHYSFVEFRSVDEARRAKDGLQGRLFNDPRIHIMFSSSGLAPPKDSPGFFTGSKGPRSDMYFNDPHFGPGPIDFYAHNRPMGPNFGGPFPGPNMLARPFGPQGGFDQALSNPEMFNELAGLLQNFQEANPNSPLGQNWRRSSPAPGMNMVPSPGPGGWPLPPVMPMHGAWDGSDPRDFQRETKRSRIRGPSPIDDQRIAGDLRFQSSHSPRGVRGLSEEAPSPVHPDGDICWRGVIAKGGTPVCHARCVPIGKGLDSKMPEIVNCSARTGLDMLAKHYYEASGFDIVFFLPDSVDDFASYTEFLHYLGAKNRAGVAKFDDGTTLFLVPPSDFLTKVLNVSGPERLYGVVLKLPQQKPSVSVQQQPQQTISPPQFVDRHPQTDYNHLAPKEEHVSQMEYNGGAISHFHKPPEDTSLPQSGPQGYGNNPSSTTQSSLPLTPELIATLASLLPKNTQPPPSSNGQPAPLAVSSMSDKAMSSQGWRQGHPSNFSSNPTHSREEQLVNPSQQQGYQHNTQVPPYMSQFPTYSNVPNGPDSTGQDHSQAQQGVTSRPNFATPSHGGQFNVSQQYQPAASLNPERSYGTDGGGLYSPPVYQQPKPSGNPSTEVQGNTFPHPNQRTEVPDQVQSALSGVGQGTSDGEADKNQRYQSTLQFAASLLLQIQQQQQKQGHQ
ncbi:hypothetical protein ACHQM5_028509 [Ranunculus cassubicifolius]